MFHCFDHRWTSNYKMCPECKVEDSIHKVSIEALEKIEDPRKIGHTEPDAYTKLGCVMNIAHEALNKIREIKEGKSGLR